MSKGKAIGKIEPKEQTDEQAAKKEDKKQKALQGLFLCLSIIDIDMTDTM